MSIREDFFNAKAIGSLWDVAVSLKRGNPLPIDADSVFESEAKLVEYIGDKITTVAYPGQVVAVVNADSTQIYYIDQNLDYHPVGAKLEADGKSIKVDDNVLKLVGFDEAADGLLAQVKVNADGSRTLNWVSIETIAQGDGNTTYTFTGLDKESNVYFEVKASDAEAATKIYLDTYTKKEIDDKFAALVDNDTTYTFADGTEGKFTVTPKDGVSQTVNTGAKAYTDSAVATALAEAKKYADDNDANTVYDDTALSNRVKTLEDAGFQNASQVSESITTALANYYNKETIEAGFENLEEKISAIPKFSIEVAEADNEGFPNVTTPSFTTVYLVSSGSEDGNIYNEYIFVKGETDTDNHYELLGTQKVDLTGYATETFVADEIAKLSDENGAIKNVADALAELEEAHNGLASDFESVVGDDTAGLVKDVADLKVDVAGLKAIDHAQLISDAISSHEFSKSHLTETDVNNLIDSKTKSHLEDTSIHFTIDDVANKVNEILSTEDYEGKIATAKQEAIDAALIKSVDEQFTVDTNGKLTLNALDISKVTGLSDALGNVYTKEEVDNIIGEKPTKTTDENGKNSYSGATGLYVDIYTKDEVTDLIASFTGGESAADVLAELNKYKSSNDARIKDIEDIIGHEADGESAATGLFEDIRNINLAIGSLDANVIKEIKVNDTALEKVDGVVNISEATHTNFGVIKLGSEFASLAESGTSDLTIKELNVNKLVQTDGEYLILNGGDAEDLVIE